MKKLCMTIGVFALLVTCATNMTFITIARAESRGNFIFSGQSDSIWVLNKSTRKLIFLKFEAPDSVWKSHPVTVQADFSLDNCGLTAVGTRGGSAFLYDHSSGLVTIYQAQKDQSILKYKVVNIAEDLK